MICENKVAVNTVINKINEWSCPVNHNNLDENLPSIAYVLTKEINRLLRNIPYLNEALASHFNVAVCETIAIDVQGQFAIVLNLSTACSPSIYVTNNKHICELQSNDMLSRYIVLDDDVILTNSMFHSITLYKKYIDFVEHAEDITIEAVFKLFDTIYETVSKYVPVLNEINTDNLSHVKNPTQSDKVEYTLDLNKYSIPSEHTALVTGEWDE